MTPKVPFSALEAFGMFLLAALGMLLFGGMAMAATQSNLVGSGVGYVFLAAVPCLWVRREGGVAVLGVRGTTTKLLASGLLFGVSFLALNVLVQVLIPFHPDDAELAAIFLTAPLPILLLVIAVAAPLAEEILFRGVLMQAFAQRFGTGVGITVSALMFSLYHLSPPQLIPAFFSGLALGALATRTRSLLPGMIAHAANNLLVVSLAHPDLAFGDLVQAHVPAYLGLSALLFAGGLALVRRAPHAELAVA
jgi:membrane protease YdiL (CAAX protease family)